MPEATTDSRRLVIGPFNRVEGDLEVQLDVEHGRVHEARVNASLYRGFEQLLIGRPAGDALVLVPRICGICSVSQSAAAARALADLGGSTMPRNGRLAANLILATEVLADHLTHFYLFFMPDFAHAAYTDQPWYGEAGDRFRAMSGSAGRDYLPARAGLLRVLALLAGKWPHTLALRPGGVTRALQTGERSRLRLFVREFRDFLERHLFADRLETVAGLSSAAGLAAWAAGRPGDFARFLSWRAALALDQVGQGSGVFLSAGAYPDDDGPLFPAGVWDGDAQPFAAAAIAEDTRHAWLAGGDEVLPPARGLTQPQLDKPDAYTWCKAPRYGGRVAETGALARQLVAGHPLLRDMVGQHGGSVSARIVARMVEVASLLPAMERWIDQLADGAPYLLPAGETIADGAGVGFVEAARGTLGHWLTVADGQITRYQIVAPTTWNFSPRDRDGTPGPLEQALTGLPVGAEGGQSVLVQHVVRSFDPCMACTVH